VGCHRKRSRFRVTGRLPAVAAPAPALASLAVAVCVSPQALAATPDPQAAAPAKQNQAFAAALARGGQSNWSGYDGCFSLAPLGRAVISAARLRPGPPAR
jgi:hypothetical protein